MLKLTNINVELLITTVEQRQIIRDKTLCIYKDRNLKRDARKEKPVALVDDFNNKSEKDKADIGKSLTDFVGKTDSMNVKAFSSYPFPLKKRIL